MRTDRLLYPCMSRQSSYNASCLMSVHAISRVGQENWAFIAFSNGEIHSSCSTGSEWHDHGVPALAHDSERVVASFNAEIVNVGSDGFRDS